MLVPTDKSKKVMKKFQEVWSKIRDLMRPMTNSSDDYNKKYMKVKFNLMMIYL